MAFFLLFFLLCFDSNVENPTEFHTSNPYSHVRFFTFFLPKAKDNYMLDTGCYISSMLKKLPRISMPKLSFCTVGWLVMKLLEITGSMSRAKIYIYVWKLN